MPSLEPDTDAAGTACADEPSFAEALAEAIASKGVSLASLTRRLRASGSPVSSATLSYWRSGARHPEGAMSLAAIAEIERILLLPEGRLVDLLGPTRRAGQIRTPGDAFPDDESTITETLARLGAAPEHLFREISSMSVADVRADGGVASFSTRALMQVTTGTVRALPIAFLLPDSVRSPERPRILAHSGGTVGDTFEHPGGRAIGARLELDAPVVAPGTFMIEFGVVIPDAYPPEMLVAHGVRRRSRELIVEARFPPGASPVWIEEFEDGDEGEVVTRRMAGSSTAHAVRRGFGPGNLGLRWSMPAAAQSKGADP